MEDNGDPHPGFLWLVHNLECRDRERLPVRICLVLHLLDTLVLRMVRRKVAEAAKASRNNAPLKCHLLLVCFQPREKQLYLEALAHLEKLLHRVRREIHP